MSAGLALEREQLRLGVEAARESGELTRGSDHAVARRDD
jgi:hypothetical protein